MVYLCYHKIAELSSTLQGASISDVKLTDTLTCLSVRL